MRTVPDKLPIEAIDQYIKEFDNAYINRKRSPARFYARGIFLLNLRDKIEERLSHGWSMVGMSEATDDFWGELLKRYERITERLRTTESDASQEEACRGIFNTEPYYEKRGTR